MEHASNESCWCRRRPRRSGTRWPSPSGSARTPRSTCARPARFAPASDGLRRGGRRARAACVLVARAGDDEATRVELDLEEVDEGTRVRVTESRPLAMLDVRGRDLAEVLGGRRRRPAALAGAGPPCSADGRGRPRRRGVLRPLGRHAAQPVRAAREGRRGQRHRPRSRAAGVAPGGAEAPRRAGRRRPGGGAPLRTRGALPPHPRADVRGARLDGRGGRPWDDRLAALERQLSRRGPRA